MSTKRYETLKQLFSVYAHDAITAGQQLLCQAESCKSTRRYNRYGGTTAELAHFRASNEKAFINAVVMHY